MKLVDWWRVVGRWGLVNRWRVVDRWRVVEFRELKKLVINIIPWYYNAGNIQVDFGGDGGDDGEDEGTLATTRGVGSKKSALPTHTRMARIDVQHANPMAAW